MDGQGVDKSKLEFVLKVVLAVYGNVESNLVRGFPCGSSAPNLVWKRGLGERPDRLQLHDGRSDDLQRRVAGAREPALEVSVLADLLEVVSRLPEELSSDEKGLVLIRVGKLAADVFESWVLVVAKSDLVLGKSTIRVHHIYVECLVADVLVTLGNLALLDCVRGCSSLVNHRVSFGARSSRAGQGLISGLKCDKGLGLLNLDESVAAEGELGGSSSADEFGLNILDEGVKVSELDPVVGVVLVVESDVDVEGLGSGVLGDVAENTSCL